MYSSEVSRGNYVAFRLRFLFTTLFFAGIVTAHSPLVPKSQQVHYSSGQRPLKGLNIVVPADAADEDRFAASELVAILSARCSILALLHDCEMRLLDLPPHDRPQNILNVCQYAEL